jgi:hypothetical protein
MVFLETSHTTCASARRSAPIPTLPDTVNPILCAPTPLSLLSLSLTRSLSVSLLPTRNHHATHPPKPSPRNFPPTQRCCFHCYNSDDAPTTTTTGARPLHHLSLPPQISAPQVLTTPLPRIASPRMLAHYNLSPLQCPPSSKPHTSSLSTTAHKSKLPTKSYSPQTSRHSHKTPTNEDLTTRART